MSRVRVILVLLLLCLLAGPVAAQQFEPPKQIVTELQSVRLDLGASFLQSYQSLRHSNTAQPAIGTSGEDANRLTAIAGGFNLAAANLNLVAQLTPGIQVVLESYLSSRHQQEFWLKGGYVQLDESPIKVPALDAVMSVLTIKAGQYTVNYGDAHYRRTENGSGLGNPFAENLILDAFTAEIGGEVIARYGSFLGVFGVTNGQADGDVAPGSSWAFVSKLGVDHRFNDNVRVRLTGSSYQNDDAGRATLYGGDRAGSGYWGVMDNGAVADFRNGRVDPNFTEEITAYQLNPFVQLADLELFGVIEKAEGRTLNEQSAGADLRQVSQYAVDGVYRLLDDRLYVGARYNSVTGELFAADAEQRVDRKVVGAGWFITPHVLLKSEYVTQRYRDFASSNILNGGKFNGFVVQGLVSF
jgi:hypothetical protein